MPSLSEHQILVFFLQLLVLVVAARGLGSLARRLGQPGVVGELAAGLLLGPSVLGAVAPGAFTYLFPGDDPIQGGMLSAVAWIGVTLLLTVTGFETDIGLLRRLGRAPLFVSVGSIVVPLAISFGLGLMLPRAFVGPEASRSTFALFIAVSLSISALAVIGKILTDLNLMRRNVGQILLAGAMANDLAGWLLLGTFVGIAHGGGFDPGQVLFTVTAIAIFLALMLTVGQRGVDAALRRAMQSDGMTNAVAVTVAVALAAGVITQFLGVEAVLGAFVAGIVLGRSRYQPREAREALEWVTGAFFAPLFFATAGLRVDLTLLGDRSLALWTIAAIVLAMAAKSAGAFAGGLVARLNLRENIAVSVGLNARGTLEIVVATVALALGVFTPAGYTLVIVLAMTTAIVTPPLLRAALKPLKAGAEEAARLEREAVLDASVIASTRTALLPTRGGANSVLAARLLNASLQPDTSVTVLTVHGEDEPDPAERAEAAAREAGDHLTGRKTNRLDVIADDAADAICSEARLGYGVVAIGMTEGYTGGHTLSPVLQSMLTDCAIPVLLVKSGQGLDPHAEVLPFRRIMVPAIGTKVGQAAQEIAYTLADRIDAAVDVVHVVSRPDQVPEGAIAGGAAQTAAAAGILDQAQTLAQKFGRTVNPLTRNGPSVGMELVITADETEADLLVLGATVRSYSGQPFLGHGIEYLLEHARQTVMLVIFPAGVATGDADLA